MTLIPSVYLPTQLPTNIPPIKDIYHQYIYENSTDVNHKTGRASLGNLGVGRLQAFFHRVVPPDVPHRNEVIESVINAESLNYIARKLGLRVVDTGNHPYTNPDEYLFLVFLGALWYQWGDEYSFFWLCALYKQLLLQLEQIGVSVPALHQYFQFVQQNCRVEMDDEEVTISRKRCFDEASEFQNKRLREQV